MFSEVTTILSPIVAMFYQIMGNDQSQRTQHSHHSHINCIIYKIPVHIFSKAEALADGRVKRTLRVSWGKFDGYGKNSKIARATAAKLAVKALDRRDSPGTSQGSG